MSAQTSYSFSTQRGAAGGIVDLAPLAIDTFINTENDGVLKFGMAVVNGTAKGKEIKKPVSGSAATDFIGITTNNRTTEYDLSGALHVRKGAAVGVMAYGRIFARVTSTCDAVYGDALYMVKSGDDAGLLTNKSTSNVAIAGRFINSPQNGVAEVELFNQAQPSA